MARGPCPANVLQTFEHGPGSIDIVAHLCAQARLQSEVKDHIVIRPRASRPKSGFSQFESSRDPRAQHMVVKQARSVTPQPEQEPLPALPRASTDQARPCLGAALGPHVPSDSGRATPLTNLGTAQPPEVLAAAQALLQSHLQQLAVEPAQMPPQLLGLFHALCTNPSNGNLPRASTQALGHESNSPLHRAKSQTCKPAREEPHHDKMVSDSRCQAGKALRLSRSDTLEQAAQLNQTKMMNADADSAKAYSTAVGQQDAQSQAAVYAQHLYGLLAAQAQVSPLQSSGNSAGLTLLSVAYTVWYTQHTAYHSMHSMPQYSMLCGEASCQWRYCCQCCLPVGKGIHYLCQSCWVKASPRRCLGRAAARMLQCHTLHNPAERVMQSD